MLSAANAEQTDLLIEKHGLMKSFTYILTKFEDKLKHEALEAILTVLDTEDCAFKTNAQFMREAGLVEIFKDLAKDDEFSSNAGLILEYFSDVNEEKNEKNQGLSEKED